MVKRRRKPKKLYKTVITLKPPKERSKFGTEPIIEIDTVSLRPKLISSKPKLKPKPKVKQPGRRPGTPDEEPFKLAERYDEGLIQRMEWVPVNKKTRWKCIRCGWCCTHEWRVNVTWNEYDRLKDKLPISEVVVDPKTGMSHPFYMIKNKCVQYDPKTRKCKIYKERTYSCATYPFAISPEGKLIRSKFCKGFDKGETVNVKKMIENIKKWRKRAGMRV